MILSVDEVKTHLRIQHDEEDDYIESLVKQAQAAAEEYCRVSFESEVLDPAVEPAPIPETVRLAVLLMVSHYYENRDNPEKQVYITMRMTFENLLYPHRNVEKMF